MQTVLGEVAAQRAEADRRDAGLEDGIADVARRMQRIDLRPLARDADDEYVKYISHERGKIRAKAFRGVISKTELDGGALVQDFEFSEAFGRNEGYDDAGRPDAGDAATGAFAATASA